MCTRKTLGVLSLLALISIGLYHFRRHLLGRWLHLRVPHFSVVVHRGLLVPTPDGISLATDHYTPKSKGLYTSFSHRLHPSSQGGAHATPLPIHS